MVTDYYYGFEEGHHGKHRYIVSTYLFRYWFDRDAPYYELADQYMTIRKYDVDVENVVAAEKDEILRRLRRVIRKYPERPFPSQLAPE